MEAMRANGTRILVSFADWGGVATDDRVPPAATRASRSANRQPGDALAGRVASRLCSTAPRQRRPRPAAWRPWCAQRRRCVAAGCTERWRILRPASGAAGDHPSLQGDRFMAKARKAATADVAGFRVERDSMGELQVPVDALWGAQTQRAVLNFPVSGRPMPRGFIRALGLVKAAAATVNGGLDLLPDASASAIRRAALEVAQGRHDAHFPVDVYQTGSGTSSNMNANEVIATLASTGRRRIHPNDHVNLGQSSNDVVPTAIRVSAQLAVVEDLLPALRHLR